MKFIIPPGARVLDIGCGDGSLLAALEPSYGVGIDFSPAMIERARAASPHLKFVLGDAEDPAIFAELDGPFDYIIVSDTIGMFDDIDEALRNLHAVCTSETRLVIAYYSPKWEKLLHFGTRIGWRMPQPQPSLISVTDFINILDLSEFEPIRIEWRQLLPLRLLGLGPVVNRLIAPLPGIRRLCLRLY